MEKNLRVDEGKKEMLKGAFALTLSVIIVKIIGFIYKVPLSHILKDEGMGYYNCAYTVFTFFFMLCTGGIPKAVSIIVTEFDIKGRGRASEKTLSLLLAIFAAIGIFLSLLTFILSDAIASIIGAKMASGAIKAISPAIFFVSLSGVLRGFLNGRKKLIWIALSEVMDGAFKFILGLTLALLGYRSNLGCTWIASLSILGVSIASLVSSLFLFVSANILKTRDKTEQKCCVSKKNILKRILKIAVPITLSSAILSISSVLDLGLVINRLKALGYSESDAVALFGNFTTLAVPLLNLVSALTSPVSASALPELSASYALGNKLLFKEHADSALKLTAFIVAPASIAFFVFPLEILSLLFNDASAAVAAPLLAVLSSAVLFLPLLTAVNTVLEASSKTKLPFISTCVGLVFKTVLSYLLVSDSKIGILGAPISTAVCYGASLILSLIFVKSELDINIGFFSSLFKPAISGIISIFAGKLLYDRLSNGVFSPGIFSVCAILIAVFYALMLFFTEKKEFIKTLNLIRLNKKMESKL